MVISTSNSGVFVYIFPKIFCNLSTMKTWDVIDKAKVKKFVPNNMESIYPHLKQNDCHQNWEHFSL